MWRYFHHNVCADGELLCRSVWSERSGVAGTDVAISRCRRGEEMMGCSSYAPDGVGVGETIAVSSHRSSSLKHLTKDKSHQMLMNLHVCVQDAQRVDGVCCLQWCEGQRCVRCGPLLCDRRSAVPGPCQS